MTVVKPGSNTRRGSNIRRVQLRDCHNKRRSSFKRRGANDIMQCTERGSKLVSAANYTVMSRHQSYDVLSCLTMPSLLVMAIAYLSWSLSDVQCFTQQRSPNGFMYVMGYGFRIS